MIMSENETFESLWPKWEKAMIGYATVTNKTQGLYCALKALHSSDTDNEDDEEHTSNGKFMYIIIV